MHSDAHALSHIHTSININFKYFFRNDNILKYKFSILCGWWPYEIFLKIQTHLNTRATEMKLTDFECLNVDVKINYFAHSLATILVIRQNYSPMSEVFKRFHSICVFREQVRWLFFNVFCILIHFVTPLGNMLSYDLYFKCVQFSFNMLMIFFFYSKLFVFKPFS